MTFPTEQSRWRQAVVNALAVVFLATTFLASPAFAQQAAVARDAEPAAAGKTKNGSASAANAAAPSSSAPATAATSSQKVQLRQPTKEETEALLEGMKKYVNDSPEGLTVVRHPNGMLSLDLEDRYQNVTVAKIGVDGAVSIDCVVTVEEARRFLEDARVPNAKASITLSAPKANRKPAPQVVLEER